MNGATVLNPVPLQFRVLVAAVIAHALIVVLIWFGIFYADLDLISGSWWLLMFWLWPVWPLLLVLHPVRTFKRVAMPVTIGVALLAPCFPTAFAFTAWSLGGFAP